MNNATEPKLTSVNRVIDIDMFNDFTKDILTANDIIDDYLSKIYETVKTPEYVNENAALIVGETMRNIDKLIYMNNLIKEAANGLSALPVNEVPTHD